MAAKVAEAAPLEGGVDPKRVREIAAILGEKPFSFGPPISDREAWEKVARHEAFKDAVSYANRRVNEPIKPMTLEVYSLYAKTGQRTKEYDRVRWDRHSRIATYTIAECIENQGRFIRPLEDAIVEICAEPTWILNFHDTGNLDDWHGRRTFIDLGSSIFAGEMAQMLVLVGDKLRPEIRELVKDTCRQRILEPYKKAVESGSGQWWIASDMNWNSVCHNGVVQTALGVLDDREERAFYVASAEKFIRNYLRGFGPDGYCNEGMGYWTYGFTHFTQLSELVLQATGGKVNFFDLPGAKSAAMYPTNLEITRGVFPSYADCALDARPPARLSSFLARHYRVPLTRGDVSDLTAREGLVATLMYSFLRPELAEPMSRDAQAAPLRSFFDHGGVLVSRPAAGSNCRMAVSFKGGHNAESHNHNDLGTFVVALGNELLILDPGGEIYTSRTFSKERYKSNLLNSFGHPVPVIAGKLQRQGKEAAARIIRTDFTDARDIFALDITSAYDVPELQKLTRQFTYDRTGEGSLQVVDEFEFSSPQTYGGALLTYKKIEVLEDGSVVIRGDSAAVKVTIDAGGAAYDLMQEAIEEQTHSGAKPTRLGINLREPLESGKVALLITPLPAD